MGNVLQTYARAWENQRAVEYSLEQYLGKCSDDPSFYAGPAERLLKAIGEPKMVDTSQDPRFSRIFLNRTIKVYPAFEDFYGMEDTIERIVGFFRHAAQGLEERKQVVYLLGPVGGGKSSLAERLKQLMEKEPVYVLKAGEQTSPVFESPLGLFDPVLHGKDLEESYGIPPRRLTGVISPWAVKRLEEFGGDITKFTVVRLVPSRLKQICIAKTEPGDENNQDVSSLVGKVDIRKLEKFGQSDPDAYAFTGGLNRTTQGLMEFVEMFKAPIKMLHPLLTATQDGNYAGTENIGGIPYQGIILAHSNEAEWQAFKNNKNNEAFIDRISVVKVAYCLRSTEERMIYTKMLSSSELSEAPCAPKTLEMLADIAVYSRLGTLYLDGKEKKDVPNIRSKIKRYDGEDLKDSDPQAKSMEQYRQGAGVDEGMSGLSTRFAFKVLSSTFNFDTREIAADPVHLLYVLEQSIHREQFPEEVEKKYLGFIKSDIAPNFAEFIGEEIRKAYLESYTNVGQDHFDRYVAYADAWLEEQDYKNPDTGELMNREEINIELTKTEKPAGIANTKDFRNEVVKFVLRARTANGGQNPEWTSYEKLRKAIEQRLWQDIDDLLPVISFAAKKDSETKKKHDDFVERMVSRGYTPRQVRRLVEWYMRTTKTS